MLQTQQTVTYAQRSTDTGNSDFSKDVKDIQAGATFWFCPHRMGATFHVTQLTQHHKNVLLQPYQSKTLHLVDHSDGQMTTAPRSTKETGHPSLGRGRARWWGEEGGGIDLVWVCGLQDKCCRSLSADKTFQDSFTFTTSSVILPRFPSDTLLNEPEENI